MCRGSPAEDAARTPARRLASLRFVTVGLGKGARLPNSMECVKTLEKARRFTRVKGRHAIGDFGRGIDTQFAQQRRPFTGDPGDYLTAITYIILAAYQPMIHQAVKHRGNGGWCDP
jgi:hypothetical protein